MLSREEKGKEQVIDFPGLLRGGCGPPDKRDTCSHHGYAQGALGITALEQSEIL